MYLQKGFRWIPGYQVTLDGNGKAAIKLQATLLNELADLDDVTANLVIGVPSFAFKDTLDPIALQQTAAQLSPYFQQGDRMQMLSNAIVTQSGADAGRNAPRSSRPRASGPTARIDAERGPLRLHGQARDDEEGRAAGGRGRRLQPFRMPTSSRWICRLRRRPRSRQPQYRAGGRVGPAAQRAEGRAQGPLHEQEQLSADDGAGAGRARQSRARAGPDYLHRGQRDAAIWRSRKPSTSRSRNRMRKRRASRMRRDGWATSTRASIWPGRSS